MAGSAARAGVGLLVGLAAGFFAANLSTHTSRPAAVPAPAAPADASAPPDGDELSDVELRRAMAVVDAKPNDFEAQYKLAEALLRISRRPEDAIKYYTRASTLKPNDPKPQVGLGDANFVAALSNVEAGRGVYDSKRLETAAEHYERALALDPKDSDVHAALGMTYYLRRPTQLARAAEEFRKAVALDRANELALQGLASTLAAEGDLKGAEQAVADLEAAAPNSPALMQARADLERARGGK